MTSTIAPDRVSHIIKRPAGERGRSGVNWLDSRHTFSFSDYYDPRHVGFHSLRVINEDRVEAGMGFPTHPHRDMEIFSYVLEGALEHKDSMGHGRVIRPGQIQLMSAGRGITHSEYNPGKMEPLHFLQVWILPREAGLVPSYTEWHPADKPAEASKVLVISPDGREGSAVIHQDAAVFLLRLSDGVAATHRLRQNRGLWLQVMKGRVSFNGTELAAGDGASVEAAGEFTITATGAAEALLFDLAQEAVMPGE
jgi:redox-sensitive bicupin YhaK (pirin superfamily)